MSLQDIYIGARCIIASKACSTKKISKSVSNAFKVILKQMENFHHKSTFYTNYKKYWAVQNSMQIIPDLDKINKRKKAKSISTYDFASFYTKLTSNSSRLWKRQLILRLTGEAKII